jgi:uncharacterized protein (TIGR00369 family)
LTPAELSTLLREMMPFGAVLGLEAVSAEPSAVVARTQWTAERCTAGGILHGGFLMSVADSVGATVAFLNLPDGATTSTIESKTNLFRPVSEGTITATGTPVHVGRSTIVVQTDITRADGKLASRTVQTQAVLHR